MNPTPRLLFAFLCLGAAVVAPMQAQTTSPSRPLLDGGLVLSGQWMQANAMPLNRDAMHSVGFSASARKEAWAVEGGYLRIARDLSTIQGGFISAGPILRWKQVTFLPAVSGLLGQALASVDTTGYDFTTATGEIGHVPRYSYSEGTTVGGGVGLTVEVPLIRALALRASASQWYFGGTPLEADRNRTVLGLGLSLKVWQ